MTKLNLAVIGATTLLSGALLAIPTAARADDGPWLVRLRGIYIAPTNDSDAISVPGALSVPKNSVHESDKWAPEMDFEYFFASHWSSELVLTYPQRHDVTVKNATIYPSGSAATVPSVVIGSFKELPPTLTLKYNFLPDGVFRPYVGAGINVTSISDVRLNVPTVGAVKLESTTVGFATQAGFDYRLVRNWFMNVDLKYVQIEPDLKYSGRKIATVKVDPILAGVGIAYRF
ncbi:MAG TPA: OmpW family outer membrane protein [Steroidobacteraceae bacterium]|nr:OmpW family outer membrane protein [Steroidobacteraceae bacterium]